MANKKLSDDWLEQQRAERTKLLAQHGIKPKQYELLDYVKGELVRYREVGGPTMVKLNREWVVEGTVVSPKERKTRKLVTPGLRDSIMKRLQKGDRPAKEARDFDISASTVSKIKKELENG